MQMQFIPFQWPTGQPHTAGRRPAKFDKDRTLHEAIVELQTQMRLLKAPDVKVASCLSLRMDGLPKQTQPALPDVGVALYFKLPGGIPCAMGCDKWNRATDNLYALAKHIEALRGQDRWGVQTQEQAFQQYRALPALSWRKVLGLKESTHPSPAEVKAAFERVAHAVHPDLGGNGGSLELLKQARDAGLKECGV